MYVLFAPVISVVCLYLLLGQDQFEFGHVDCNSTLSFVTQVDGYSIVLLFPLFCWLYILHSLILIHLQIYCSVHV